MENKGTLKHLFENVFNVSIGTMKEDSYVDVSDRNIGIKSLNHGTGKVEFNRINKLIRKSNVFAYIIRLPKTHLKSSLDHRLYVRTEGGEDRYETVESIIKLLQSRKVFTLDSESEWQEIHSITESDEVVPIVDLEVDNVHNYFSNGVLSHNSYVPSSVTTGGKAVKFFASQRIEVSKGTQLKSGDEVTGYILRLKVVKNKLFPPFKKAEVDNVFGVGIDKLKDLLSVAVDEGIVQRSGSWYSYEGVKLGQGLDKVRDLAADNPEMIDEIKSKLNGKVEVQGEGGK